MPLIGKMPLRDLTAADVRAALTRIGATRSCRTVTIAHGSLIRAIRHAEANDLVRRNVAALIRAPKGSTRGRPSRALNLGDVSALLEAVPQQEQAGWRALGGELAAPTGAAAQDGRLQRRV